MGIRDERGQLRGATSALLVVLAARRLHTSGGGYGLLLGAIAAGAFTGPILLARLPAAARRSSSPRSGC